MNTRLVTALVAVGLVGGIVAVVSMQHGAKPGSPLASPSTFATATPSVGANCLQLPKRTAKPSWFPADLPVPDGSYPAENFPATGGAHRVTYAVKGDLTAFVRFVLDRWRSIGWMLGRGDAEPGEADDSFRSSDGKRIGAFKARSVYCDPNWTLVLFVLADTSPQPSASGS